MANIRAIRARIKSVESTRQITASMKVIAASKLRRVQALQSSLQRFETHIASMFSSLMGATSMQDSPYVKAPGSSGKVCYVMFVGNRGMCGVYNITLLKKLQTVLDEEERETVLAVCGRWGKDIMSSFGIKIDKSFDEIEDTPDISDIKGLCDWLLDIYLSGQVDEIKLIYQQFQSVLKQVPAVKQLLPIEARENQTQALEYIFEPDSGGVQHELEHMYFENSVYSTLLEAKRGEHAARMAAMTAASDNTDELLKELELQLNHARQAAITTEITEIVGGASALQSM